MPEFPSPSDALQELIIYKAYAAAQKAFQQEFKKVEIIFFSANIFTMTCSNSKNKIHFIYNYLFTIAAKRLTSLGFANCDNVPQKERLR